jgi:hypothetical protein
MIYRWTPDYLSSSVPSESFWTVYRSRTKYFRYWHDTKRAPFPRTVSEVDAADVPPLTTTNTDNEAGYVFTPPTRPMEMTFPQFLTRLRSTPQTSSDDAKRYYLQTKLTQEAGVKLMADFANVVWNEALTIKQNHGFGPLTTNMLLVGQAGNTTPAHYDEQVAQHTKHNPRLSFLIVFMKTSNRRISLLSLWVQNELNYSHPTNTRIYIHIQYTTLVIAKVKLISTILISRCTHSNTRLTHWHSRR